MHTKLFLRSNDVLQLEKLARPFPTTVAEVLKAAKMHHFNSSIINLLASFPSSEHFSDSEDFISRLEELMLFISEEHIMPKETVRNP